MCPHPIAGALPVRGILNAPRLHIHPSSILHTNTVQLPGLCRGRVQCMEMWDCRKCVCAGMSWDGGEAELCKARVGVQSAGWALCRAAEFRGTVAKAAHNMNSRFYQRE